MSLINLNQINLIDAISVAPDGAVPIAVQSSDNVWSNSFQKGMLVPKGTTGERLALGSDGYLRYNTDLSEFEVFSNLEWRPIGQLTQDGTVSLPIRSFISDETTGTYLISSNNYGITAGGNLRVQVSSSHTKVLDSFSVDSTASASNTFSRIISPTTNTGNLIWADVTDRAFIRYNHSTDNFEFSGDGEGVAFEINGTRLAPTTNYINVISPISIEGPMSFGSGSGLFATTDAEFDSVGGFIFNMDTDDDDTSTVFKIQRHINEDTGFEVNQEGQIQLCDGAAANPGLKLSSSTNSVLYFKT